VLRLMPDSEL